MSNVELLHPVGISVLYDYIKAGSMALCSKLRYISRDKFPGQKGTNKEFSNNDNYADYDVQIEGTLISKTHNK